MNKIVLIKETSTVSLAIILLVGTITLIYPSFIIGAQAEPYYGMDSYDKKSSGKDVSIKKVKCNNINVNVNGLDLNLTSVPFLSGLLASEADEGKRDASYYGSDGSYGDKSRSDGDFKFICLNNNNNTVIEEEEPIPPTPPTPPEPTTATLIVKKQVFGCVTPNQITMDCTNLQNNSPEWLDCNTNPAISGTIFCQSLPESIFDIEVLDDQSNPIQQFEGSEQGTTIQNLEPGTYTVNEIKHLSSMGQLGNNPAAVDRCTSTGFPDGGDVTLPMVSYRPVCFEYEDEQGNDCSTITLAAGEERTCIVKNYINFAIGF